MTSNQDAPRTWLQLRFVCDAGSATELAECLSDCGALAVSLDDARDEPLYEPPPGSTPLWSHTRVSGLFAHQEHRDELLAALARRLAPGRLPAASVQVLQDQEWVQQFQDAFEPVCFGGRLWVVPSWAQAPPLAPGQVTLTLDPGLAFGTGSHPTTGMCLEWLAAECVKDRDVVDFGCGSGILAVAAAKLGARHVWAVDNDPQALAAARRNAAANQVDDRVQVCDPSSLPPLTADLVVSNILANTLSRLAGTLSALLRPGARLALAGILEQQAQQVLTSFAPGCRLRRAAARDGWVLLAGARDNRGA